MLEITVRGKKITLGNLYGPNEDRPQFYSNIKQKIEELDNEMAIICGDWNLILDPELDCENYKHVNNPKARTVVKDLLDELEIMDSYRLINEEKKGFTWRKLNPEKKTSQTGFFSD